MRYLYRTVNDKVTANDPSAARLRYRTMKQELKDRIRIRLDKLGISARKAALDAGASDAFVRNILQGKSISPRMDTLINLAQVLQTTEVWLMRGEGAEELSAEEPSKTSIKAIIARTATARTQANITIPQIAKALNVTESEYETYEKNTALPANLVHAFCQQTRISADWLFSGETQEGQEAVITSHHVAS